MAKRVSTVGFIGQAWVDRLVAPLAPGSAILDLGCGDGEPIARYLMDRGFDLTGVDSAGSVVTLATTRFPRGRWIKGDMRIVDIPQRFDAVIAWNSLTWLTHADCALMAKRAAAWLKPEGRMLFNAAADLDPSREDYRDGSPYRVDLEAADYSTAIADSGLSLVARVLADPACEDAGIWLAEKR
jgi:cyclopropane fatty-acyl-phospholipid synthase-like methyltransferase